MFNSVFALLVASTVHWVTTENMASLPFGTKSFLFVVLFSWSKKHVRDLV